LAFNARQYCKAVLLRDRLTFTNRCIYAVVEMQVGISARIKRVICVPMYRILVDKILPDVLLLCIWPNLHPQIWSGRILVKITALA